MGKKILVVCTTDSMIWNFLVPHIKELESRGHCVECACSKTGSFFDDLREGYSLIMHPIPFERSPYNKRNYTAYKDLKKLVKGKKYDVIFCHEPVGGLMGRLVGRKCGCKVIYMAHGFHFYKGAPLVNNVLYYLVEKYLSRLTDALITINEEDYQAALKFHAKSKYKINGIGIDTNRFLRVRNCCDLQSELGLERNDYLLLSVGELIERKNHLAVIEALYRLDNPHIHLAVAGSGELYHKINTRIHELNLGKQVHLLGYRTDINRLCNSADAFVFPSFQEGLSVALMEAMACGKPVIASRIRGNVDLIDEKRGGYLVSPHDIDGFSEAIADAYKAQIEFKKCGEYNLAKIKQFDIDMVKQQLSLIYDECLEERA